MPSRRLSGSMFENTTVVPPNPVGKIHAVEEGETVSVCPDHLEGLQLDGYDWGNGRGNAYCKACAAEVDRRRAEAKEATQ